MKRITVIGAGFGALTAVRKLREYDANVQIDVVAPNPEFVIFRGLSGFQPACANRSNCLCRCIIFSGV
jgi:NADH dehydrogenase FAD-containing subunit